jgi:hypothetical protein
MSKDIKMIPANLVSGGKNSNGDKFEIDEKEHVVKNILLVINRQLVPL